MADFGSRYPALKGFLNAWVGVSDEDETVIVDEFKRCEKSDTVSTVAREAEMCLRTAPFPGLELGEESNRYFASEDDAKEWLEAVTGLLR